MALLAGSTQLKNVNLDVVLLTRTNRVVNRDPDKIVLTLGTAIAEGGTTASITSSVDATDIKAGNGLSFVDANGYRKHLLVLEDATVGTVAGNVSVSPALDAIEANSTAEYIAGLVPVYGMQNFALSSQDTDEDITNTLSGFGTEVELVRSGKSLDVSVIQVPNDPGLYNVIKKVSLKGAFFGREIYAVFTNPDGEVMRGAAKVRNFQQPGTQNAVKRGSFQLTFQGDSFEYLEPYVFI